MTDETTGTTPGEQTTDGGSQQQAPDGFIDKARYTGAVQKIEALTNSQKALNDELAAKSSQLEQLNQRLAELEAGLQNTQKVKDASIAEIQASLGTLQQENAALKAFKVKADLAKSMGRPDLLPVLDYLPNFESQDMLQNALKDLAGFADNAAATREAQLRAGIVDTSVTHPGATQPASAEAWIKHIESLPIGSKERLDASDKFGDWLKITNK